MGVVGITGQKGSKQGYGQIVKELVELMIGENERKKVEAYQMRTLEGFAKELIKNNSNEDLKIIKWRANLVNFDLLKNRSVIVCDIIDFKNKIKELVPVEKNPEIIIQKLKQKIISIIQSNSEKQYDFVFNFYEDRFIILKSSIDDLNNNTKEILRTIKVYFSMNMNIKDTASEMFIHRNTVIYRFNKLKEVYNIDITNSVQCMKLYTSIIIAELNEIL